MKPFSRLLNILALLHLPLVAFAAESPPPGDDFHQAMLAMLQQSLNDKKGVVLYVQGQEVGGGVVRLVGLDAVELRNQTYGKILIRLDRIDGLAMH